MTKLPAYVQIHNQIRQQITDGHYRIGDRLPAERQLSQEFHVSRMTLRQALGTLVDEGILESKLGSGTYVADQRIREKMYGTTSFTALMEATGKKSSSQLISFHSGTPSESERQALNLTSDDQIMRLERVRFGDDEPIAYEVASMPAQLIAEFPRDDIQNSLYATLESAGYQIGQSQQIFSARSATEEVAELLELKRGDAVLYLRQITSFADGMPFEYVRTQYAGKRYEVYINH